MIDAGDEVVFECALEAPPEKVWRALTVPAFLQRWLDMPANLDLDLVSADENRSLTYRWREKGQGTISQPEDSLVTFELQAREDGGTWFRLTHVPRSIAAANNNEPAMMRAAS